LAVSNPRYWLKHTAALLFTMGRLSTPVVACAASQSYPVFGVARYRRTSPIRWAASLATAPADCGRYSPHMTSRRATSPTQQTPTAKTEIATPVVMLPSCLLRFGVPRLDHIVVEAIGEGEVLAALASEGGALRTPHRKRPTEYRPFPALLAGQYDPFRRTVHARNPLPFCACSGQLRMSTRAAQGQPPWSLCESCGSPLQSVNRRFRLHPYGASLAFREAAVPFVSWIS
jgi:hypothetical protein